MKENINLIGAEIKKTIGFIRLKKKAKFFSEIMLSLFIFFACLVTAVFFYLKKDFEDKEKRIASLRQQIQSLDKNESYLITISSRIQKTDLLLKETNQVNLLLSSLESLFVPGFKLTSLELKNDGKLTMAGSCDNSESLADFNDRLDKLKAGRKFSSVFYPEIGRKIDGSYQLTLELKQ